MTINITPNIKVNSEDFIDSLGFRRTRCWATVSGEPNLHSPSIIEVPMLPPIKVHNYDKNDSIGDQTVEITEADLIKLFEDFVYKQLTN